MIQNKKYRVLQVHNYYQIPGGEDTVLENERKLLEDDGHTVIQYTRNNSELKYFSVFRKVLLPFCVIFNLRTYQEVKKIIREQGIDIVHVHNTLSLISPSVYYAALHCKTPVVQTIHNFRLLCPGGTFYRDGHICEDCIEHSLKRAIKYRCYRGSKLQTLICVFNTWIHRMTGIYGKIHYICLTEFNKKKILLLKQITPEKIFIKPNFVSICGTDKISYRKRSNQFVYAGRLEKQKGTDFLLKTWKLMGKEAPKLVLCGTGPLEEWCRTYIKDNQLNTIEIRGFVPNVEVRKLIAESKALILPTQCYEGFPLTIVEAYSVGTPVIGSNLGNTGSLIIDNKTGMRFEYNNPQDLAEKIRLLSTRQLVVSDEHIRQFSEESNCRTMVRIYDSVTGHIKNSEPKERLS